MIYINDYSQDFSNRNIINEMFDKDNIKLRVKPQEMIKLYDNLIEYGNQLISLEKENPDQSYLTDLNYRNKIYAVFKIFYVGLFYLINKKYEDVYTIMHHILEKIKDINEFYDIHNLSNNSSLKALKSETENLESKSKYIISKSYVKMSKDKMNVQHNKNAMIVDSGAVEKKEKTKVKFNGWLYDQMSNEKAEIGRDTFEMFKDNVKVTYEEYVEAFDKGTYNNYSHIIQLPPNNEILNPKPIVYDLTYQKFAYPNLDKKIKKTEDKGLMSRAFGMFWKK